MKSITVAYELVHGFMCCCGDPECRSNWPDTWKWVARSGGNSITGDTADEARADLEWFLNIRATGRFPTAAEMAERHRIREMRLPE